MQLRILFYVISTVFLFGCSNVKNEKKNIQYSWIKFEWVGDSIGNRYFDNLAINIPITIDGIPHKFNSQFDLGAISTMVYGNTIKPYLEKDTNLVKNLDTINKTYLIEGRRCGALKNISFSLDTVSFKNQELAYFGNYGIKMTADSVNTKTVKQIGTIGSNLFQDKYLIIDFPRQRIAIVDFLNKEYKEKTTFVNAKFDNGRVKVPVNINNEIHYLMYDTGSSSIALIISEKDLELVSNSNAIIDTLNVSSWGRHYDIFGYKINQSISIGNYKIKTSKLKVYENPTKESKQFFDREKIMGIMGNMFFLDQEIIIDYKNKRFGIRNDK